MMVKECVQRGSEVMGGVESNGDKEEIRWNVKIDVKER